MTVHLPVAGIFITPYLLLLAGFLAGLMGGFFGVSGSFLLIPLLNALGFPVTTAIGTNLAHTLGRSALATIRNNALASASWKIGLTMGIAGAGGVYLGERIISSLEKSGFTGLIIRLAYLALLCGLACYLVKERACRKKSDYYAKKFARVKALSEKIGGIKIAPVVYLPECGGRSISLWFPAAAGVATGLLSGFLGVSGSSLRLPFLVLLVGMPVLSALCTDILATLITFGTGTACFASAGWVETTAAVLLLAGSVAGFQTGVLANRYASRSAGTRLDQYLLACVAVAFAGVALTQLGFPGTAALLLLGSAFAICVAAVSQAISGTVRANQRVAGATAKEEVAAGENL